ncbi:MAG: sorbosone dehydrogenase family protein [Rhodocyclaceae bacterium]|nr:sorbosone dehydrogenase family protein [Rhodocyclaceae bacterium]
MPILLLAAALAGFANAADPPVERLRPPPGVAVALWARVENARQMALGGHGPDGGIVYVGSMRAGKVHAVRFDGRYRAGRVARIAEGLQLPVGVAWRDGRLYVSAVSRILRFDGIDTRLDSPPPPVTVTDRLPTETHHGWKFIAFGPDGRLYVPVGAPCNICEPDPDRYANILAMDPDGGAVSVHARGIRNSVGFDWHPETGELWFTDNGRDWLGDDSPPDELNRAPRPGMHFGYPYCHGGDIADPEFGSRRSCAEFTPPAQRLMPHAGALGMRFYDGGMFPPAWRNQVLIAEHGSWNRSRKIGYRVSLVRLQDGRAVAYETFMDGWLAGESAWGRPADLLVLPDGSLLVSDDQAGAIYRVTWRGAPLQDRKHVPAAETAIMGGRSP